MDIDHAIVNGKHKEYDFDDLALKQLFLNELNSKFTPNNLYLAYGTDHRINNFGFRDDDFTSTADILIAGCSHSFGIGIDEEYTWASIVKQQTKLNCANVSVPGYSVPAIILNIFAYIKNFGNPKVILCAMPDFSRLYLPQNVKVLQRSTVFDNVEKEEEFIKNRVDHSYFPYRNDYVRPKFSQLPHRATDIIPLEVPYWMAFQSLNILEQYCQTAGIKLYWGTWDVGSMQSVNKVKSIDESMQNYNNFITLEAENWYLPSYEHSIYHKDPLPGDDKCFLNRMDDCENKINCHSELEELTRETFTIARDRNHWGTHRHAHIAEIFLDKIKGLC
jgi:hypothetical protein